MNRLRTLLHGLPPTQLLLVIAVSALDGLFQALGVASIMPFISLLADPETATNSRYFDYLQPLLPTSLSDNLILATGLLALFILILSNAISILDYWLSLNVFCRHQYRLSTQMLGRYLSKGILEFNRQKVSDMSTTILSEIERVVIDTLMATVGLIADLLVIICVSALMLMINPVATLLTVLILGGGYLVLHFVTAKEIESLGSRHAEAEAGMFSGLQQALMMHKESRLTASERWFLEGFRAPARNVMRLTQRFEILTFVPAQLLEVLTFVLMVVVAIYFSSQSQTPSESITIIAFYAFAAYRLMPVIKSLLSGVETFRYGASVVDKFVQELKESSEKANSTETNLSEQQDLVFKRELTIENLGFTYPDSNEATFRHLNARIPANKLTCITGPSGSGKSTLLDILMGLLEPDEGRWTLDDIPLSKLKHDQWLERIAYIPQQVQLLNASVAANIALAEEQIDSTRLTEAARLAGLEKLINKKLSQGFDTPIGEGGHNLSSGERQRIGIARALYRNPNILFMDEATNELDDPTERDILLQLQKIPNLTMIFATHKKAIWEMADHLVTIREQHP